jgi:hypothetical protein
MFTSVFVSANVYYIDSNNGDDTNDGLSKTKAWQSIGRVNLGEFEAGDSILFKRGEKWIGTLKPAGSGNKDKSIVIGAYDNGELPIIDAEGKMSTLDFMSSAIILYNQECWEIRDLEIRNYEKGNPENPLKKAGILVLAKDIGTLSNFKFENLKIVHINGSLKTRENGGIFFNVIADKEEKNRVPTNFDNIYRGR